jgi:hypothetical protein
MPTKQKPAVPPTRTPSRRDEFEARRGGVVATGPSGLNYKIIRLGRAQAALAGKLTTELKRAALREAQKMARSGGGPAQAQKAALSVIDADQLEELEKEERETAKRLILATVVEPPLSDEDLEGEDPFVPTVDQDWLEQVATGQTDEDGQGRRLWGPEPLSQLARFRHHHECPEDCAACSSTLDDFTAFQAIIRDAQAERA